MSHPGGRTVLPDPAPGLYGLTAAVCPWRLSPNPQAERRQQLGEYVVSQLWPGLTPALPFIGASFLAPPLPSWVASPLRASVSSSTRYKQVTEQQGKATPPCGSRSPEPGAEEVRAPGVSVSQMRGLSVPCAQ